MGTGQARGQGAPPPPGVQMGNLPPTVGRGRVRGWHPGLGPPVILPTRCPPIQGWASVVVSLIVVPVYMKVINCQPGLSARLRPFSYLTYLSS
jgi:hypothetical protein